MKVIKYFPGIQFFDISGNKFSVRNVWTALFLFLAVCNPIHSENPPFQPVPPLNQLMNYNVAGSHTFKVPAGVTSITVETWGGGGRGGSRTTATDGTGGGGGGAYSKQVYTVTPGQVLNVNVGAGSSSNTAAGGDSWVSTGTVTTAFVLAKGGNSAASNTTAGATGGSSASGIGTIKFSGGNGANRVSTTSSGGGGSSAGTAANGTNASGTTGGVAPTNGGNGANGRTTVGSGAAGSAPGGGGSGAVRGTTGSPAGGNGGAGKVLITYDVNIDAGPDQSQCQNARFVINSNIPPAGYSITWSVVSGNGFIYDNSNPVAEVTVPAGNTATIRLSVSNGTTTVSDDVVLTNTTSCTPLCTSPLNSNGDFELRGTATADNLSFQSTPATLIYQTTNPVGWSERYGSSSPNTTAFTGAYYINKTGANGNPKSGSRMVYMAGEGFCLSSLKTFADLTCGRTYRVSAWVAAFTNSATQTTSTFAMEFISGGNTVPDLHIGNSFMAPASTSWNNLNWQRYSFEVTIPSAGYEYADFLFTTLHNVNGIVIDDMCIEEISSASRANAGPDQFNCSNSFTLAANTPPAGYSGVWSVVSGSASISNTSSPSSTATISSGNNARLRWTVNGTGGTRRYTALDPADTGGFESCCSPYDNGWTAINNGTNDWYTGSVPGAYSGTNAAYISNNGGTNHTYNITTAQTSHLYRDIKIHPDATNITLSFQWKGMGQASTDRLLVYTAPTTVDPVAGVPASTSTILAGATLVSGTNLTTSPFYKNATITLPNSLAGNTVRLIFTWQNNSATGTNPPVALDEVSVVYNLPACNDFDEVNLLYGSGSPVNLDNVTVCPGVSTTLTPTGCSGGSLAWSNGSTSSSITVNPVTTTTYSVTCTPAWSSNLLSNAGFESTTDLEYWDNWASGVITTIPSDVYAGSKALKLDALVNEYGGVAQGMNITPGQKYRLSFYAKTNNSNQLPSVRFQFWDNNSIKIEDGEGVIITSATYQYYTYEFVTPPTATWVSVFAEISGKGEMFVDNFELTSISSCPTTDSGTVNVLSATNLTLSNLSVGSCINHPLQDIAQVSVQVAWTSAPSGDQIGVTINNKTEFINVAGGATSPQTITFSVPANGATNIPVTAGWYFNPSFGCSNVLTFNAPNPCSSDILNCDILYLCGLDKPADGDAFDHGVIEYIMANNSGNVVPVLVKDNGTSNDFYNPMDQVTPLTININDYDLIILSPTTEGYVSSRLANNLLPFKGSILNMNYGIQQSLGLTNGAGYYAWGNDAYTNDVNMINVYNYDNINANYSPVKTGGTTLSGVTGYLWMVSGNGGGNSNTMGYKYNAHSIPGVSTTHGHRQFLGLHMNGLYSNSQNGGFIPAPVSSYFHPAKHLTPQMKIIFDQTLKDASKCTPEICANGIDDDGDGLTDCADPDCYLILNREFDEGFTSWDFYQQGGAVATRTVDNTSQLSGKNSARINISTSTGTNFHIQFAQTNVLLEAGKTYRVSFRAKASANRVIGVFTDLGISPWTNYFYNDVNLTTTAQTFTFTYTHNTTTPNGRIGFNLGQSSQTVWIDNILFYDVCLCPSGAPVAGTITQPTCSNSTGSVVLNGLPSSGTWTITRSPGNVTYTGTGTSYTVTGLPAATSYTFTVTNSNSCVSPSSASVVINAQPSPPTLGGNIPLCLDFTTNVTPNSGGTWSSSNTAIATITNAGLVTGVSAGSVTLTYTRTSDGCSNAMTFSVTNCPYTLGNRVWVEADNDGIFEMASGDFPLDGVKVNLYLDNGNGELDASDGAAIATQWTHSGGYYLFKNLNRGNYIVQVDPANFNAGGILENFSTTTGNDPAPDPDNNIDNDDNGKTVSGFGVASSAITLGGPEPNIDEDGLLGNTTLDFGFYCSATLSYVALVSNNNQDKVNKYNGQNGTYINDLVTTGSGGLSRPYGMAYGPNGDLFVSSSFGDAILRYNGQTGAFISTFVSAGSGGLDEARGLTFGPDGNLYVNSYNTDQVKRYNGTTGAFIDNFVLSTTGLNGPHTSLLFSPDGFLYVASLDNDKVMKFDGSTGALMTSYDFSIFSELSGADFGPRAMVFGPDGNLYVGTRTNNIYKITLSTGIITVWGTSGLSEYYSGVNFGPDGRLYAVAVSGGTVRRFNYPSGTYLDRFDSGGTLGEPKMITFSPKCGSCPASLPSGNLCLGATLQLSPASGGMWTSNNPAVATITNSGLVTAVSVGVANFTFVNSTTACSSTTSNLTVNTNPSAAGASTVCVGETANITPGTNGTWTSSNSSIATITNAGVISGISAGSVTFTYTRTADGCTATWPFTVLANPVAPLIGTITQPTCSSPTGSVILTGLPSTGSWTITRLPGGTTYSGSGTSYTVTGLPSNTTYTFRVTNANTCTSVPSSDVVINTPPSAPSLGGASAICAGSSANVTPSTNGTWTSSNNSVATITNVGVVNGLTAGTVTLTYTRTSDGCSNSLPFTVYALPSAPVVGTITHPTCITATGSVLLNGLPSSGMWTITRTPGGNTYTGTGTSYTVTGLTPNTSFTFVVTNADLCTSASSNIVAINAIPANPVLGGATSVCAGATTNVTPSSNGTWSSANNGIATVTNAGLVTGVSAGSVILTYTRTSDGCANTLPFTVFANPSAPVPGTVTQPTCTTPTGSVILSGLPSSGTWTITRSPGGNTYTGTGTGYTLTGLPANATYTLTVTNSNLCTSPSSTIITINAVPGAPVVGGAASICAGLTANVTPTTNGTWASSNNSVATVSNAGLVTANSAGAVTLTYTRSSDGCSNTLPFTVFAIPTAPVTGTITQPDCTHPTGSVVLTGLPSSGNWTITRTPGAATYSGTGSSYTVTGLSDDTDYTFKVTNSNNCTSPSSGVVSIDRIPSIPTLSGPDNACVGSMVTVSPTNNGTWASSNTSVATITNAGVVTAIAPGTVNLIYTRSSNGCIGTKDFTVFAVPSAPVAGTITQPTCAITTGSVVLNGLPSSGTWTLTRTPGGNTYTGTGTSYTVTGLAVGTSYTFTVRTPENCTSLPSAPVVINGVPNAPSAAINYMGSLCITDNKQISVDVSGGASPYTYLWTGPSSFTGNTQTITITQFGTYNVTVTDANMCKTSVSGYVNERYNPIIINLQSTVCEGENVFLDINTTSGVSYLWSANAGSATTKSVTVTPAPPSTTYLVTVTNDNGCTAVPTVTVNVNPKPVVSVSGASGLCPGQTTNLLPASGGTWTSSNPAVATVTNTGIVTAISQGTATFIFTNSVTNCSSDATTPVTVNPGPVITLNGPANICVGNTTQLLPSSGGTWTSSNPAVATINSSGVINGLTPGGAQFTYTNSATGCVSDASTTIQVGPALSATIDYNGNICLTDTSKLSLITTGGTPNYTYTWTGPLSFTGNTPIVNISSNGNYNVTVSDSYGCKANVSGYVYQRFDPYIVNLGSTICEGQSVNLSVNASSAVSYLWGSNAGNNTSSSVTVFPLPPLTNYFVTVTNDLGCKAVANAAVNVHPKPVISISGGNPICSDQTSQLSPNTGGTWVSLNPAIASVTNTGLITGISQGTARFIFTQAITNCVSDTSQTLEVKSATSTNFDGPNTLCTGQQTNVQPSSGGTWSSLHPAIATVSPTGIVTPVSPGVASLRFTNSVGCITNGDLIVTVNDKPAILLDGPNQICPGETTQMLPTTGGTWTSTDPGVATVSNTGLITGVIAGTARFIFTSTFSGCISDSSVVITVKPSPTVSVTGSDIICAGNQTTLSPSSGGMWVSNNPAIASVNNQGIVTGISNGTATFTFFDFAGGCPSLPTTPVTVNAKPIVTISGPTDICIGGISNLLPATGGTWTSSHPAIASVNNTGLVTGLAPGNASFIFTNTTTGCVSLPSPVITVYSKPTISINNNTVCVGNSAQLTPSTGGTWTSSNTSVATVSGTGLVNAIAAGNASFTFTEHGSGCASDPGANVTVLSKPIISVVGPGTICPGQTTQLIPASGGTWTSEFPSIASVNNNGLVTGLSGGTTRFIFTTSSGCQSDPGAGVTINEKPNISISGPGTLCIGATTQLNPSSGGTWTSSNPVSATVTNTGLVTAISSGTAKFIFTHSGTGCVSDSSALLTVSTSPDIILVGPGQICIEQTTQLSPSAGGTWVSLQPSVASVTNTGLVTGVSAGTTGFRFIQSSTGCEAVLPDALTVLPKPIIEVTGTQAICIGGTTNLSPTSGGTWTSLNPLVAVVNNSGVVTGISAGSATFRFTLTSTGCTSNVSTPVTVLSATTPVLDGPSSICKGSTTQFLPNTGGTWSSSNTMVATISSSGLVTAIAQGNAHFFFTDAITGCISNPSSTITVYPDADVFVSGPTNLCIGYQTILGSSSAGVWNSTRSAIAPTTSNGLVTGNAPGKVTFYFTESSTGCITYLPEDIITVTNCFDPDFNVTLVNVPLNGNVATNDETPSGTSYHNTYYLISKPSGSNFSLVISPNGNYTFQSDLPGVYEFETKICYQGIILNCPGSNLVIHVVNSFSEKQNVIPNTDIISIYENESAGIITTFNDRCIMGADCNIDTTKISITSLNVNGNIVLSTNGNTNYTPDQDFIGQDTIVYNVCASNDNTNCKTSKQIVTVMASNANNTLVAGDDFFILFKGGSIENKNLLVNDFDPENEAFSIIPQGSVSNKITLAAGQYYIQADGQLFFTPNPQFTGPVDIIYTICDNQNFCVKATAHILVLDNLKLRIRAYLEGALMENGDARASDNRPLMRDDLRVSPITGLNYIPSKDPYSYPTIYNDISVLYTHVGAGSGLEYRNISDSAAVFGVTGENAIVDWVFVELRSKNDYGNVLATRSALIQRDGDVVDLDGISFVAFPGLAADSCYVILKHRNHLGVMSEKISVNRLVDFTLPSTPTFDFGNTLNDGYDYSGLAQKANVVQDYMSLWAGDFDSNGKIKFVNPGDDHNMLFIEVLTYPTNIEFTANYNFAYGYLQGDYNLNGKSKYDNPDDDKNMLFYQILFYPLNEGYLSNFNSFIQQIPPANRE